MISAPRGHKVPQTVENLQDIMAADAVLMMEQAAEIAILKIKVNNLQQKLKSRKHRAENNL